MHEKIVVVESYQALSLLAAESVAQVIAEKPNCNLALPTGRTPQGCYQYLSDWSKSGKLSWSKAHCFALDDYLDTEEKNTFKFFLEEKLYRFTDLPRQAQFNPASHERYDELIERLGGLDCTILGIGLNGHIAFNEPPTPKTSWTHCVSLTDSTKVANQNNFARREDIPSHAITMGIATLLESRKIILIVSGKEKKSILARALTGGEDAELPASFLSSHPNLLVIADFQC